MADPTERRPPAVAGPGAPGLGGDPVDLAPSSSSAAPELLATWFGASDAPLFGAWHLPPGGRSRGTVVLCPPLGREHDVSHRAYRHLADELALVGFAALRFDYASTGDSADAAAGSRGLARVLDDVATAVATARASGSGHVTLLGLRSGALVAVLALGRGVDVDALVAWDPLTSGRHFLRHEKALRQMSLEGLPEAGPGFDGFEGAGFVLSGELAADLRATRFPDGPPVPSLVLVRDGGGPGPWPDADPSKVQLATVPDLPAMLDVPDIHAVVPTRSTAAVIDWLRARTADEPASTVTPTVSLRARVPLADGTDVDEEIVRVGPRRLFGIVSRPAGAPRGAVVFIPLASHYHAGVPRLAVDAGRDLARRGYASLRYDPVDLGDSPRGGTAPGPVYYDSDSITDLVDVVTWARADTGADVAVVGSCAGAWTVLRLPVDAPVRAIYLLNPINWHLEPHPRGPGLRHVVTWRGGVRRRSARIYHWARRQAVLAALATWARRAYTVVAWRLPASLGLADSPTRLLDRGPAREVPVTLLLGPLEQWTLVHRSGFGQPQRLRARTNLRFVDTDIDDHSLFTVALRSQVLRWLPEWVHADMGTSRTTDEPVA